MSASDDVSLSEPFDARLSGPRRGSFGQLFGEDPGPFILQTTSIALGKGYVMNQATLDGIERAISSHPYRLGMTTRDRSELKRALTAWSSTPKEPKKSLRNPLGRAGLQA